MLRNRVLGASLFGAAFALAALAFGLLGFDVGTAAPWIALGAALSGAAGGAWVGGNVIAALQKGESWGRGSGAGLAAAIAGYAIGVGLVVPVYLVGALTERPRQFGPALVEAIEASGWVMVIGAPYFAVASVLCMVCGVALWWWHNRVARAV